MALFKILKGSGNLPTAKTEGWAYVKKINDEAAEFYVDYDANTRLQVGKQYNVVSATEDGIVPKFDAADGRIDSNSSDWVLTNNNGSLGWYRLPTNAFKNDDTNTTYTLSGAADGNTWVTTLTGSDSATTTSTVPAASTTAAGLMTPAMVEKLNGIAAGATANRGDITQVTAGDGLTGGAASGNATLSANLGLGLVIDAEKKIAANTSYTSANKNYAVKTDSSGALYVNVPWSDTDTHYTTRIYTGASGATANATSPVSNPYITVTDNNVYRTQVQLKGDGATSISADDGVITISSTNTTYSAFKGASASENGGTGLVPAPTKGQEGYYLRGDGVWFNLTGMDESVQNTFGALQKAWKEADSSLKDTLTTLINGKAQTNHASSGTSYGISTASLYGHAMASSTTPKASAATAAVGSETAKFARGDHVHPLTVSNAWTAGTSAGPTIATTVNSVTGTAVAIPTASASASGAVIVGDQTFGGIKRFSKVDINATYHLGSFYNYGNGCLIDIGPAKSSTMVAIHITGNSYSSSDAPINSLYQVYDYGSGTTMNYSGISIGQDLGAMKVYRYNNRLYAHIVQKTSYSTLNITLYTNKTGLTPTVTNAVAQASGYTDLVTITPSRPPLADSGVTAGSYGPSANASPAHGGTFSVPYITFDAKGRATAASTKTITLPTYTIGNATITIQAGTGLKTGGSFTTNQTSAGTITLDHSNSITAGSVGSEQSPSHGGTFAIPKITYDAQGHITEATTVNITLPADNNTDTKVTQTARTTDGEFPVLVRGTSAGTGNTTTTTSFRTNTSINLSTGLITEAGVQLQRKYGTLFPAGTQIPANADLNTTTYLKVGNYYCSSNATAQTLTNCPDPDTAFMMQVYSPLSTTIDNETTSTWVYRLRRIQLYTGQVFWQYCYAGATAGSWTYGSWYSDVQVALNSSGVASLGSSKTPVYVSDGKLVAGTSYGNAIKSITRSGTTFTYTCIDGTTGTFTQQDNNTNYYHSPLYTAGLNIATGSGVNNMYVPYATASQYGAVIMHPAANCTSYTSDDSTCTVAAVKKAVTLFTNDYAPKFDGTGATGTWGISISGNAATANALTVNAGSAGQPVYFTGGVPTAIDWHIGNQNVGEHNCNNITYNFAGYYTSNGPAMSLGPTTNDGAIWAQAYSSSWVAQMAQDYRDGSLYVRGRNSGTWTAWQNVILGNGYQNVGPIKLVTGAGANNLTANYISAGRGYSTGSGLNGLKLVATEQDDAISGIGQDCTGKAYELSIAAAQGTSGQGYITFVGHKMASLSTYTELGHFNFANSTFYVNGKIGVGTTSPEFAIHAVGDIYANGGWLRSSGNTGWYSQTHGGGWYMSDGTYVRSYNSKAVVVGNNIFVGTTAGNGTGLSLYSTTAPTTYGIHMSTTSNYGTHGDVQSDWATYFNMNAVGQRGWIYRAGSTNVASVSANGVGTFKGIMGETGHVVSPDGGRYTCTTGSITGYLKITLPVSWNNTMFRFAVDIFDYSGDNAVTYLIGGYNYDSPAGWHQLSAQCVSKWGATMSNLDVHFGHDGSKCAIYIGSASTKWAYPQVIVRDVLVGYGQASNIATWSKGWSIGFTTTLGSNVVTKSNTNVGYNVNIATKTGDGSLYLYPHNSNELNFGGTNTSTTIYMGYRATDSRPVPTKFVFGGSSGSADLQAKTIYLGSGTTSYISSSQYTGNAATASSSPKLTTSGSLTSSTIDSFLEAGVVKWGTGDATAVGNNDGVVMSFGWSSGYGAQMWLDDGSGEGGMKIRNRTGGTAWNPWRQVLTENNYTDYAAPASHTHSYAGSSSAGGAANSANVLNINATANLSNCLQYIQQSSQTSGNDLPSAAWWHVLKMNHGVGDTYYKRLLAFDFFSNKIKTANAQGNGTVSDWKQVWVEGDSVTGAVWNDYAEYRESDCQEFGRVLSEKGDDTLTVTTERLQPFAGISSDTWGFCQGETEKAKTPIAVAGRVLAYTYKDRNEYKPGDCVCAAPNGTVDIMTREEIIQYPDRIVGTVSCVPDYETWGSGDRDPVQVDGRIWIKVK